MRAFAEFVMRGRMQATLGVVGSAAFPLLCWLSAAGGGLVLSGVGWQMLRHPFLGIVARLALVVSR